MIEFDMEDNPELLLPSNISEELFDLLFVQSHALLNSVESKSVKDLDLDLLTNIVSNILRIYDIYDLYKENLGGLLVMYASWVILESLKREGLISFESCSFDTIFNNEILMQTLEKHHAAFEKRIQTVRYPH